MRLGRLFGTGKSKKSFQPKIEALEDRFCPSVTIGTAHIGSGTELRISTGAGAETVNIVDNGAGHVDVRNAHGRLLGSADDVSSIRFTGGGADTIGFVITDTLTKNTAILFSLAAKTNALNVDLAAGMHGANLLLGVQGNSGADTIRVTLGAFSSSSRANLFLNGGGGNDNISVVDGHADIPVGSSLRVDLAGGDGNDNVSAAMSGAVFGTLMVNAYGGAGTDDVNVNVKVEEDSTGKVVALVDGGTGRDHTTLYMNDYSADNNALSILSLLRATIRQKGGQDATPAHTPNVTIVTM